MLQRRYSFTVCSVAGSLGLPRGPGVQSVYVQSEVTDVRLLYAMVVLDCSCSVVEPIFASVAYWFCSFFRGICFFFRGICGAPPRNRHGGMYGVIYILGSHPLVSSFMVGVARAVLV